MDLTRPEAGKKDTFDAIGERKKNFESTVNLVLTDLKKKPHSSIIASICYCQ